MADTFDLAEGVIKLTGDTSAFDAAVDHVDAGHAKLEQRMTERSKVESKRRAEGWVTASAGASARLQEWAAKNKPLAMTFKGMEANQKKARENEYAADAMKHGRAVADYIESKRDIKENRRNQKLVDAFKFGRFGGPVVGGARALKEGLNAAQPAAAMGAAAGVGAMGMAGAASPLAMNTFTESLTLAAAKIGRDFVPALLDMAFTVQKAANWWEQLDKGVKKNIVEVTKFVAITGGMLLAMKGIVAAGTLISNIVTKNPLMLGLSMLGGLMLPGLGLGGGRGGKEGEEKGIGQEIRDQFNKVLPEGVKMEHIGGRRGAGAVLKEMFPDKKKDEAVPKLGSFGPSSFSSLSDFYKKTMLDTTGGSELEAELLKVQTETRDAVVAQRGDMVELLKIVRERKGGIVN